MLLNPKLARWSLLSAAGLTGVMVGLRTAHYRPFFSQPGAGLYLAEALVLLALYSAGVLWGTSGRARIRYPGLIYASAFGLLGAAVQTGHLLVERFITIPGKWNGRVVLLFMLVTFSIWAFASFSAARAKNTLLCSLLAGIWCAVVTMLLAVFIGTLLELYVAPIPPESMRFWPEFTRSGWNDLPAFAIANTLDSITSHLVVAPVLALLLGLPAGWAGSRRSAR